MKETAAAITAVDRRIDRITTIVLEDIERQRRDTIAEIRAEREAILEPRLLESVFGVPFIEGPAGPIPGLGDRMA